MKLKKLTEIELELDKLIGQIQNDINVKKGLITRNDLFQLSSLRKFIRNDHSFPTIKVLLISFLIWLFSYNYRELFRVWQNYSESKCIIPLPNMWQNAFVPANDCGFCRNITQIDRVHSINSELFSKRFFLSFKVQFK